MRKRRELYLHDGVRIHLDQVEQLGTFLEFEAVLGPGRGPDWGRSALAYLSAAFAITSQDIVPVSYLDLAREVRT